MGREPGVNEWIDKIRSGDTRALARALTEVENGGPQAEALLRSLFPFSGRAWRIGITGAPGAGKSSLVDRLAAELRREGKTVGIIGVDPTSPYSGGAILGDRIRMQRHASDSGIFIRSMATRGSLGGLARATVDAALVLDAAGRDVLLIETVGVGQDEVEVVKLADVVAVVVVPGMGDDVQTLKAGILEIADIFVINKSDREGADRLEQELRAMLDLAHRPDGWTPPIVRTVATEDRGIPEWLAALRTCRFPDRMVSNWKVQLVEMLRHRLTERVLERTLQKGELEAAAAQISARQRDPYQFVEEIISRYEHAELVANLRPAPAVQIDHLGIAVRSLDGALEFYQRVLGLAARGREEVPQEKVRVAMLPAGEPRIELLEATAEDSPIARFIAKRGEGLHHVALRVPDLAAAVERLRAAGARLVTDKIQSGAGGHRYIFVHPSSAGGVLLELVEEKE